MVVLFWYSMDFVGCFGSRMHIQGQVMLIGVLMVGKDERLQWVVLGWAVGFVCKRYTQAFAVHKFVIVCSHSHSVLLAHLVF